MISFSTQSESKSLIEKYEIKIVVKSHEGSTTRDRIDVSFLKNHQGSD